MEGPVARRGDAAARRIRAPPCRLLLHLGRRRVREFVGSDDHGTRTANRLSLIATARLHGLHPEAYLREVLRVLPHWPTDWYLQLSPKHWAATRARLDAAQLAAELGPFTVPPPEAATAEEQSASR